MKKILSVLCVLILIFTTAACSSQPEVDDTPVVNPVNLSFSLLDGDDDLELEDFEKIENDPFIAEEGSTVLEATQLYCMSHDISISVDSSKGYVTEIAGLSEGDYNNQTGWVFTVNGEMGMLAADEQIVEENDKIAWEFIDFSAIAW
ncbi:MAG: DUF4430 domain-containing protein [Firmicutes bacterium]|nr:DUF4430 domain-containing protein [Bacillota bacterium]